MKSWKVALVLGVSLLFRGPLLAKDGVAKATETAARTRAGLAGLPMGAQAAISATLGRDDRTYHAARSADRLRASNGRHYLRIEYLRRGVTVEIGRAHV